MSSAVAERAEKHRLAWPKAAGVTASLRQYGLPGVLLVLVAAYFIAAFAGIGLLNALDPNPSDGLEHGAVQEVGRLRLGQPLYVARCARLRRLTFLRCPTQRRRPSTP